MKYRRSLESVCTRALIHPLEQRQLLSTEADLVGLQRSVLADMNGDGKADLVAVSSGPALYDAVLTIGIGSGDGRFVPSDRVTLHANTANAVAVGDLNGDGALDVAIAGDNPLSMAPINSTFVLTALGNGDGKFKRVSNTTSAAGTPIVVTTFVPQIARARALALADLDHNGFGEVSVLGVARSNSTTTTANSALVVNWDPTLPTLVAVPPTVVALNSLVFVNQLHTANFDGDGKTDLVATNRTPLPPSLLTVVRNDLVTVRFPIDHTAVVRLGVNPLNILPPTSPTTNGAAIETFAVGDLNNDGTPELIGRRESVLRYASYNSTSGQWGPVTGVLAANAPPMPLTDLRAGDVTGDGKLDVLAVSRGVPVLATNITTAGSPVAVRWSRVPIAGLVGLLDIDEPSVAGSVV